MQTFRHFFSASFLLLLLCNSFLYSQETPSKIEDTDSTLQKSISIIPEINELVSDSVKTDTIKPKEELLTGIIDYYGEDYVYIDKKENKVYMYNNAYITYEDMRIESGYIILDYSNNEIYAKGIDSAGCLFSNTYFYPSSK